MWGAPSASARQPSRWRLAIRAPMQAILWSGAWETNSLTYLRFRGVAQVQHTRGCQEIRHGSQVPDDYGLLRHKLQCSRNSQK
jgi:hypothetical protein